MRSQIITAIMITVCSYSCGTGQNGGGQDFEYTINLDSAEEVEAPLISTLCNGVSTIILEMDGNAPMATVDKIIHADDRLYVSDRPSSINGANVIAEFDLDGKFIRRYGNRGRGPGEYIGISDFTVDEKERRLYLFDQQTQRIMSYDLDNGKYVKEVRLDQNNGRSNAIASVGDLIYMDTRSFDYDESNHMLKSWNKANPEIEKYYLTYGEHLGGWTNTVLENNNRFIWRVKNDYCLFSNKYSNEVFKCTSRSIDNYIYVKSDRFIDKKWRQDMSAAWNRKLDESMDKRMPVIIALGNQDYFREINNYFETDKYIGFRMLLGMKFNLIIYNKSNGETKISTGFPKNDIVIKADYFDTFFLNPLQADIEGMFYGVQPDNISQLRTAAREGMLVDDLDKLDELKELKDYSNPVLFYMKFKEPLK